jgi:ribulose-5-phosphate 4-epimerase/fuculose-1-phosphate aldolase
VTAPDGRGDRRDRSDRSDNEDRIRRELAAAFRWTARLGWHEAVANHFSAMVDDQRFLLNPMGQHFSRITASDLLLVDSADAGAGHVAEGVDITAWYLHAHVHRHVPRAKVILHTHMPYATTLACLEGYEFQMLDQNACRFFRHVAYDRAYGGMVMDDSEGARVARLLGAHNTVLLLGNHGVIVVGETVAEAWDDLYHFEHACRLQVLALSTGRPLAILSDAVAATTAGHWNDYPHPAAQAHLDELMAILDADDPGYAV